MRGGVPCRGIKHTEACRTRVEGRLREEGYDMTVPTKADGRDHTRLWLAAAAAADAMDL